jgi:hypothetical protein
MIGAAMPKQPHDLEAQRAAMKKLDFLVGKWTGHARISNRAAETAELLLTEEAGYRLGGLILVIEGMGSRRIRRCSHASGLCGYQLRR